MVVIRSNVERNGVSDSTKKATTIVKEYDSESKFSKPKSLKGDTYHEKTFCLDIKSNGIE